METNNSVWQERWKVLTRDLVSASKRKGWVRSKGKPIHGDFAAISYCWPGASFIQRQISAWPIKGGLVIGQTRTERGQTERLREAGEGSFVVCTTPIAGNHTPHPPHTSKEKRRSHRHLDPVHGDAPGRAPGAVSRCRTEELSMDGTGG